MKFLDLEKEQIIDVSGTKVTMTPMSLSSQTQYLMLVGNMETGPDADQEAIGKKLLEQLSQRKMDIDNILLKHIKKIEGFDNVGKAIASIADPADYLLLLTKLFEISTLSEDEKKN